MAVAKLPPADKAAGIEIKENTPKAAAMAINAIDKPAALGNTFSTPIFSMITKTAASSAMTNAIALPSAMYLGTSFLSRRSITLKAIAKPVNAMTNPVAFGMTFWTFMALMAAKTSTRPAMTARMAPATMSASNTSFFILANCLNINAMIPKEAIIPIIFSGPEFFADSIMASKMALITLPTAWVISGA